MLVLGIMSGTSIDAVDCAVCQISRARIELRTYWQTDFPRSLRSRLNDCARGVSSSHEMAQLHHDLGRFYVTCARNHPVARNAALIGLHGQTVFHQPTAPAATFQLGEPAYLAESFRAPVISNFRAADIAAGGQGAPLATLFHQIVFGQDGEHICVNNLGGISNVTSLDAQTRGRPRIAAFDTGPGNILIDLAMRKFSNGTKRFDANGAWAKRGRSIEPPLKKWLRHSFFQKPPPKSTGRELFGELFLESMLKGLPSASAASHFDQIATITEFTARSLVLNYRLHLRRPPDKVILTGGGAQNPELVARIGAELQRWNSAIKIATSEQSGWPSQAIEPAAFALLAYRRWHGLTGNIPETTGARDAILLGQITQVAGASKPASKLPIARRTKHSHA